jgi:methylated-DNA-[protein]-cysteine S-methyltransferase
VDRQAIFYTSIPSRFGSILLLWRHDPRGPRVVRVVLPEEKSGADAILQQEFPAARRGSCAAIAKLSQQVGAFLRGRAVDFPLKVLDFGICSQFQRRVLPMEARVGRGTVTTYGRLAARLGAPGAARAVGNALARNPFPLIIPCHRCVLEGGQLGGFRGGLEMKRALLEMEGVVFDDQERVLTRFLR